MHSTCCICLNFLCIAPSILVSSHFVEKFPPTLCSCAHHHSTLDCSFYGKDCRKWCRYTRDPSRTRRFDGETSQSLEGHWDWRSGLLGIHGILLLIWQWDKGSLRGVQTFLETAPSPFCDTSCVKTWAHFSRKIHTFQGICLTNS